MSLQSLEPVAIIGMACEFAGDIHSPFDLWQALVQSRDLCSEIPPDRMDLLSYCAHMINQDAGDFQKKLIRSGYFMSSSSFDTFEPSFFGLSDGEAITIDPCHRLLMLKVVHLLEDAGYPLEKVRGSRTSVHIGQFSTDASLAASQLEIQHRTRYHTTNSCIYNASARLSYHFDLHGPNLTLDTACSSSLQAVHLGVQSLRLGEVDMAICGGVNSVYTAEQLYNGSIFGPVSVEGRSRAFSVDASGYAKAEGLGLVLLKRLSDAERDGDRIYCVLHDILSNHDGLEQKDSYVVPSPVGQHRLLMDLYERTKFDRQKIFYIEAHGTGTQVGDPIEANALGKFFQRSPVDPPLLIGSIKSNIGHAEGAAGIASLIKVAMCMVHRAIPANMNFSALNPKIEKYKYNLHVVQNIVPFPVCINNENLPVAIGINSFGIGGSNAHVIIEEYRPKKLDKTNGHSYEKSSAQHFLFLFAAKSRESLDQQIVLFRAWLQKLENLDDERSFLACLSRQLLLKRTISHVHLAIFVAADRIQFQQQIDAFLVNTKSNGLLIVKRNPIVENRICFVFSGQGPQWWAMGRQLYESEPIFRQWIQRIDREFSKVNADGWQLLDELIEKNEAESRINDTNIAQPALFAVQVALTALLVSWHIYPNVIISHSAGEQAAAYVSGRLSLPEAVRIIYHRSRLQHRNTRQGGRMLAVAMSEQEARDLLLRDIEHLVSVAVVNSPRSVTLSGEAATINELQQILSTFYPNVFKAQLRIENAFHSHQMDRFGIQEEMIAALNDVPGLPLHDTEQMFDVRCAQAHLYSSVTGGQMQDNMPVTAHHWWANVRQCVRFADAMEAIIRDEKISTFLEISPHPVLATSIHECCEANFVSQPLILPTLKRKENEQTTLSLSIAQLTYSLDMWQSYLDSRSSQSSEDKDFSFNTLPLYQFNKTPCWYESKTCVVKRLANCRPVHPLLGVRQWTQHTSATWKSLINLKLPDFAYLRDHKIQDVILFPAAGFLELALAACRQLLPNVQENETLPPISFEHVEFLKALPLTEHEPIEVITQVVMPMHAWFVYSRPWSTAGKECSRIFGMSGTDVVSSFVDPQSLNSYSLSEFTLHARGRIDFGPHLNIYGTLAIRLNEKQTSWQLVDANQTYMRLFNQGYQYGPQFQVMDSLYCKSQQVIGQVLQDANNQNDSRYYLNPIVFDGCLHTSLSILTMNDTGVPVSIDKVVVYGSTFNVPRVTAFTEYHSTLVGIVQESNYTINLSVFDSRYNNMDSNSKPIFICEAFKLQRFLGHWSPLGKSVFAKVNVSIDTPNINLSDHIDKIEADFCLRKTWSCIPMQTDMVENILSLPDVFLDQIYRLEMKSKENISIHDQLVNSIQSLNLLAANYALYALKYLAKSDNNQSCISKELEQYVRNDESYFVQLFDAVLSLVHDNGLLNDNDNIVSPLTIHSIQLMRKELLEKFPILKPLLTLLHICGTQLGLILSGEKNIEDLFDDKLYESTLADMYVLLSSSKIHYTLEVLAQHLKSHYCHEFCVLIIGGGTSIVSLPIINMLNSFSTVTQTKVKLLYVDVTAKLLDEAKQTFKTFLINDQDNNPNLTVSFELYDMEEDTTEMTFISETYHMAFAINALHTTSDVSHSLDSLRQRLRPGGILLLIELTLAHPYLDLIFGIFPYWWRNEDNCRAPLTSKQWIEVTQLTGGFDAPPKMIEQNPFGDSVIVLQKSTSPTVLNELPERQEQAWLLLSDEKCKLGHLLSSNLPTSNIKILESTATLDAVCSAIKSMQLQYRNLYIVFAWPLDAPTLDHDDKEEIVFQWQLEHLCNNLLGILKILQEHRNEKYPSPYVFILTQNAQILDVKDNFNPYVSSLIGLARSLTVEYVPHHIKLIDLQPSTQAFCNPLMIHTIAQHIINCQLSNNLDEVVLSRDINNVVHRFEWYYEPVAHKNVNRLLTTADTTIVPLRDSKTNPFRLQIAASRLLTDLVWVKESLVTKNLLPDQILVLVHCAGINFRDVLKASGLYPHTRKYAQLDRDYPIMDRDDSFGLDFMGTVQCSSSDRYKIGDRVVGFSLRGVFHSHIVVNTLRVVRVPEECLWTDAQLASLITPFVTTLYSLKHRAQIRCGQTVLIHAATGATGQACIQYCQSIGAQIIATAGSEQKRQFLREHYGIEHVFNSRDLSFVSEVRAVVPNGIHAIVNSLVGPLLHESIKLLAQHGHFVEFGKRDVFGKSLISLFNLREDCSFHIIDLALLSANNPTFFNEMIHDMMEHVQRGAFKPFKPTKIYEPSEVIEAFTQSSLGIAMGKSVIKIAISDKPLIVKENSAKTNSAALQENEIMFPSEVSNKGTVLISGGFGGLGLAMSRWMIEKHGVKRIVLLSRRTRAQLEQPDNNPQLEDWLHLERSASEYGTHIDIIQADVTQFDEVYNVIQQIHRTSYPVRGIIHSAVVSEDKLLENLDQEVLARVMKPKVRGAWNLHRASEAIGAPLHFFIMFSSIRNHLIDLGSSGYNAGNEFLDALAHYRCRHLQKSALSISLPAITGAGMFHRQRDILMNLYSSQGFETLPTGATFDLIEKLFAKQKSCPSPIVFAVDWNILSKNKDGLPTYQLVELIKQKTDSAMVSHRVENITDLESNITLETIVDQTRETAMRLLGYFSVDRIDINRSLLSQGMDSLAAVSLYNWIGETWNTHIPLANLLQGISIQAIGNQIQEKLKERSSALKTTTIHSDEDIKDATVTLDSASPTATNIISSYTGIERLREIHLGKNEHLPVFSIYVDKMDSSSLKRLKLSNSKYTVYVVQTPTDMSTIAVCAQETLSQIRRLQPRGPYLLYAIDRKAKIIVDEILKQMEKHKQVGTCCTVSENFVNYQT